MADLENRLNQLKQEALAALAKASNPEELEEIRIKILGRKGALADLFRELGNASPARRPVLGEMANRIKGELTAQLQAREISVSSGAARGADSGFDPTLPGVKPWVGRRHPLVTVSDEICRIFAGMGFSLVEGPEAEFDYYNFEALNFPPNHPTRDTQDTFFISDDILLRTHTSPVQIRTMESRRPPVRVIAPGRVYRSEATDASHAAIFHQIEGFYIDRGVSLADLKGTLIEFVHQLFGSDITLRFRPGFFPFTEPSAEADILCIICKGEGCRTCKGTGWLEIFGSGMIDQAVFGYVDYDPEEFTGYAFGLGVERVAMLLYGIDDIRLFLDNDLRFLSQF
jgi:phenylalanyl-tRNA synthetase alpha chain